MNARSTVAYEFKLSLEAGVIARGEIIQWADEIIANEEYDDRIADICMAGDKTDKELASLLAVVASDEDKWSGVRRMLGRMYNALQGDPDRLHEFTRFLEQLSIRSGWDVPKDLSFMIGIEDDFQLAEEGQWSSLAEIRADLIRHLARYQIKPDQYGGNDSAALPVEPQEENDGSSVG